MPRRDSHRWEDAETITREADCCPQCRAMKPIIVRSVDGGDQSRTRRCVCRECSHWWNLVIEPPSRLPFCGNGELDTC